MSIYNKIISQPLDSLDKQSGKIFKSIFYYIFKISALGVGIYGAYLLITGLYGKTGYFTMLRSLNTFEYTRSIACFILTFAISATMFYAVSAILWKRANDFKTREFGGAIFLFPRFLKIMGETIAIVPISAALISFLAIIFSAIPYAPIETLGNLAGSIGSNMINEFIGNTFSAIFIETAADYFKLLADGFIGLISGFFMSVGVLFGTYIIAELFEIIIYFLIRKSLYN